MSVEPNRIRFKIRRQWRSRSMTLRPRMPPPAAGEGEDREAGALMAVVSSDNPISGSLNNEFR